jgi:hypothetical protein
MPLIAVRYSGAQTATSLLAADADKAWIIKAAHVSVPTAAAHYATVKIGSNVVLATENTLSMNFDQAGVNVMGAKNEAIVLDSDDAVSVVLLVDEVL